MASSVDIERLPYLTVRIEGRLADGGTSIGTAFFTRIEHPRFAAPQLALITNKHVVADTVSASLVLHEADSTNKSQPSGRHLQLLVDDFAQCWIPHPDNTIDLCICPLGRLVASVQGFGKQALTAYVIREHIPDDPELSAMSAVEEVLMVGYPTGLWDSVGNWPIIRRGTTAVHPTVDFQGEPVTVVDIAAFPGSSGSPVFALSPVATADGRLMVPHRRLTFLGVLFAGPTTNIFGEVVRAPIPTTQGNMISRITIHLGYIVKARALVPLLDALEEVLLNSVEIDQVG
jgi:hypothetical protein